MKGGSSPCSRPSPSPACRRRVRSRRRGRGIRAPGCEPAVRPGCRLSGGRVGTGRRKPVDPRLHRRLVVVRRELVRPARRRIPRLNVGRADRLRLFRRPCRRLRLRPRARPAGARIFAGAVLGALLPRPAVVRRARVLACLPTRGVAAAPAFPAVAGGAASRRARPGRAPRAGTHHVAGAGAGMAFASVVRQRERPAVVSRGRVFPGTPRCGERRNAARTGRRRRGAGARQPGRGRRCPGTPGRRAAVVRRRHARGGRAVASGRRAPGGGAAARRGRRTACTRRDAPAAGSAVARGGGAVACPAAAFVPVRRRRRRQAAGADVRAARKGRSQARPGRPARLTSAGVGRVGTAGAGGPSALPALRAGRTPAPRWCRRSRSCWTSPCPAPPRGSRARSGSLRRAGRACRCWPSRR